jgi:dethiobiotin synthetase
MPRVVVLGTGTGVGKTYFTAALARALRAHQPSATIIALKPVETGVRLQRHDGAPPSGSDAALLEAASGGLTQRPHPLFGFPEPVSPHLAAEYERSRRSRRSSTASPEKSRQDRISIPAIVRWAATQALCDAAPRVTQWQLLETAGGVFSPLTRRTTNADLAVALDPAIWILVAPDSLGVLHDVRAALIALEARFRSPDFVVLSRARQPDSATGLNAAEFPRVGLPRPVAVLDRHEGAEAALAPLVRALVRRSADES